eukprot:GHVL01033548.1.p1 GENE.GHVL01033548.1~~GHVL01033548.1.p1  ORF type:complete len:624 (-),score=47.25 GHVL01033548.1:1453-3324(-)
MNDTMNLLCIFLSICLVSAIETPESFNGGLVITSATRTYSFIESLVIVHVELKILNNEEEAVNNVYFAVNHDEASRMGHVSATTTYTDNTKNENVRIYSVNERNSTDDDITFFNLHLSPLILNKGDEVPITIEYSLGHGFHPMPRSISFEDLQQVLFVTTMYLVTPYSVKKQNTKLQIVSESNIHSIKSFEPNNVGSLRSPKSLEFGPFNRNIGPFAELDLMISAHLIYNFPLPYATSVERTIRVSHWGDVFIKESYEAKNDGAYISQEFSRKKVINARRNVLLAFDAVIPRIANGLEYYDLIGNITSSKVYKEKGSHIGVQLVPRFPLLGGWKTNWVFEYHMPTKFTLFTGPNINDFLLNITLGPSVENLFVEELTTKVVLPAGSSHLQLEIPSVPNAEIFKDHVWGWFDLIKPRPVIGWKVHGFYQPRHVILRNKFQVKYVAPRYIAYTTPTTIIFFIMVIFLFYIFGGRMRLKILRKGEPDKYEQDILIGQAIDRIEEIYQEVVIANSELLDAASIIPENDDAESVLARKKEVHASCTSDLLEYLTHISQEVSCLTLCNKIIKAVQATIDETQSASDKIFSLSRASQGGKSRDIALDMKKKLIEKENQVMTLLSARRKID